MIRAFFLFSGLFFCFSLVIRRFSNDRLVRPPPLHYFCFSINQFIDVTEQISSERCYSFISQPYKEAVLSFRAGGIRWFAPTTASCRWRHSVMSSHHRIDRFARPAGPNGSHHNDFRHDSVALRRSFWRHGSHHRLRIELRHAPDPLRHPGFVFHFLSSKENRNVRTYGTKKDHYSCDITQNIINRDYSAAK